MEVVDDAEEEEEQTAAATAGASRIAATAISTSAAAESVACAIRSGTAAWRRCVAELQWLAVGSAPLHTDAQAEQTDTAVGTIENEEEGALDDATPAAAEGGGYLLGLAFSNGAGCGAAKRAR